MEKSRMNDRILAMEVKEEYLSGWRKDVTKRLSRMESVQRFEVATIVLSAAGILIANFV